MDISRVPESVTGVPDGVEAMASCAATEFVLDGEGKPVRIKQRPRRYPCKLMASTTAGIVSISAHGLGIMMTVRMDDLLNIIEEAHSKRS